MARGLLDRGPSRWDPKLRQREAAGEFSVPDSEGMVFEVAGRRALRRSKNKASMATSRAQNYDKSDGEAKVLTRPGQPMVITTWS